jgi:hypothetical protein
MVHGRVGQWIITASHHQRHHEIYKANYGLYFRFWDRICGTDKGRQFKAGTGTTRRRMAQLNGPFTQLRKDNPVKFRRRKRMDGSRGYFERNAEISPFAEVNPAMDEDDDDILDMPPMVVAEGERRLQILAMIIGPNCWAPELCR